MYHVDNSHEPIIPLEEYNEVQELLKRKSEKFNRPGGAVTHYPFTGRIECGCCGKHYRRKVTHAGVVWICSTYNTYGKAVCPSKQIPETTLFQITAEVLGVEEITADLLDSRLSFIRAENGNLVVFGFKDGTQTEKQWKDRSRAESWTDEMRESARQKTARRYAK